MGRQLIVRRAAAGRVAASAIATRATPVMSRDEIKPALKDLASAAAN